MADVHKSISSASTLVGIAQAIIAGHRDDYSSFLEKRCQEWSETVRKHYRRKPVGINDPEAAKRLAMLKQIRAFINENCRRDAAPPEPVRNHIFNKLRELEAARRGLKTDLDPHPSIERCKAELHALSGDFRKAGDILEDVIARIDGLDFESKPELRHLRRDQIVYCADLSYLRRRSNAYAVSIAKADNAWERFEAYKKSRGDRGMVDDVRKFHGLPSYAPPLGTVVYLALCDSRLGHSEWASGNQLDREFNFSWQTSINEYDAPRTWSPPMKIACLSDRIWVTRCPHRVEEVAATLFADTAGSAMTKLWRRLNLSLGDFKLGFPQTVPAAAAVLLMVAASIIGSNHMEHRQQVVQTVATYLADNAGDMWSVEEANAATVEFADWISVAVVADEFDAEAIAEEQLSDRILEAHSSRVAALSDEGSVYQV